MKIEGKYTIAAPLEQTWDELLKPEVLASCIPGCQGFDDLGGGRYEARMTVGIGAISGTYAGTVVLSDLVRPSSFKLSIEGRGTAGRVSGSGVLDLNETDGSTDVSVAGDARVEGLIARVGQRLIGTVAKTLMDQYFGCLKSRIESERS